MRILIFGDSIVWGASDIKGGWVKRLKKFLDKSDDCGRNFLVYKKGISGNTTIDLLGRLELEIKQLLNEGESIKDAIIIFAIGINDSQFIYSKNNFRVLLHDFKDNLEKLINIAKKFSSKIIFIGLTPVDELKTTPIPWNKDKFYKNEYIKKYDEIIKLVCKNNNLFYINIFKEFMKSDYKKILNRLDGLHPNSKGHQKIFEIIKDALINEKII